MPKNPPELTADLLRELLSYDPATGVFRRKVRTSNRINVGDEAGHINGLGYRLIRVKNQEVRAHRLAWLYVHGRWPADQLDHINGIRNDNRIANLRESTQAENLQNSGVRTDNKSGHPGVFWNTSQNRWWAYISINKKKFNLGSFLCREEAVRARVAAKAALHPFNPSDRITQQETKQ